MSRPGNRWKLTVEYEGSGFSGWQRQANAFSVQQAIEEAILKFSGEEVTLHVAGRTDAGVHARANVAHFDLRKETDAATIAGALNFHVKPHRVSIVEAEAVDEGFHARFNALSRAYRYSIFNRGAPPALERGRVWHLPKPIYLEPMREAARLLIGHHDFSTFRAQHCQSNSPLKTLDRLEITFDEERSLFTFDTRARSFLYHQVRNMVGTLALVGRGQWNLEDFARAFEARDRAKGGPTAPPQGLVFWQVTYPAGNARGSTAA